MRVLVAPMMAMAESAGPISRARTLATAMHARGWGVALCVPEGSPADAPAGARMIPIRVPTPLGLPHMMGKRMFPLAQKLGLNRHVSIACFDDVLKLTGNADGRYLEAAVRQLRKIILEGRFDAVYSEFSIAAIIAARAEDVPVFGTASYPTQPSYASNPAVAVGVNHVLRALSMEPVESPEDVLLRPQVRFVPSCCALEPFAEGDSVIFTGPFAGMPPKASKGCRDAVVAYLGNGTLTPRRACVVLAETLQGSGLELYVAGLPEGFMKGVHTAPHFDFAKLLPRAAVFVNHGGQNSVMDGIAYGAPQLICPGKVFERRFNAKASVRNGVGISLKHERFDEETAREAIRQLVDGQKRFQEAASVLRCELSTLGGATKVLDVMESRLRSPSPWPSARTPR